VATFDRQALRGALDELVELLASSGTSARIRIVGGAAVAIAYDHARGTTRDIDALLASPTDAVRAAVVEVARRHGWPESWLNTDAAMYAPHPDHPQPAWIELIERDGVIIEVGSPTLLLAMKLHASRGRRDTEDIELLLAECGVATTEAAEELYEAHYPTEVLSARAAEVLRRYFG
jgi:hypothetical protein